jgi:hypothetical protein
MPLWFLQRGIGGEGNLQALPKPISFNLVLLEKPLVSQLLKNNPKLYCAVHKSPALFPVLTQIKPVLQALPFDIYYWRDKIKEGEMGISCSTRHEAGTTRS